MKDNSYVKENYKPVSLSKKLQKIVKSVDSYGVPVSLTYKGDPQIKSFLGGIATIISQTIVIAYFAY